MKKIYVLGLALLGAMTSFAQDRTVGGAEVSYDRFELQDRSEDTLSPSGVASGGCGSGYTLYLSDNSGYMFGTNGYNDVSKGQQFPLDGSCQVEGAMIWYGAKEKSGGTTALVTTVVDKDQSTILATSQSITVDDIDTTAAGANGFVVYTFTTPVTVTDTFYIMTTVDAPASTNADTVGIVTTIDGCGGLAYELWNDGTFISISDAWTSDVDGVILALVNNLWYTGIFDEEKVDFGVYSANNNLYLNGINDDVLVNSVNLYDMSGRVVKTFTVQDQFESYVFDISDVTSGNYVLSLNTSIGTFGQKFNVTK